MKDVEIDPWTPEEDVVADLIAAAELEKEELAFKFEGLEVSGPSAKARRISRRGLITLDFSNKMARPKVGDEFSRRLLSEEGKEEEDDD